MPSCRLSSRPPSRTRSPGLVSRQRPAQPGDDTPPILNRSAIGSEQGIHCRSLMRQGSAAHREREVPPNAAAPRVRAVEGEACRASPPTCGIGGSLTRSTVRISLEAPVGVGVVRATRVDSHSRGLRSNVGIESHSGSGWQLIRQHVRLAHSDARNGRRSVATCGVAFSGASHRPRSSGAALPRVSLADRSPRRVPGHYAPPRSRALLSSNHGVSRRQAGAATYGRFSVRPLGPLRV